jgi:hypothetical protein
MVGVYLTKAILSIHGNVSVNPPVQLLYANTNVLKISLGSILVFFYFSFGGAGV